MLIYRPGPFHDTHTMSPKHIINTCQELEILGILLKYFRMQPKKYIF